MLKPVDHARLAAFEAELDQLRARNPGRPLVLFTCVSLAHNYLRYLWHLKRSGALVALMLADGRVSGSMPVADFAGRGFFDALCVSNPYVLEMPLLASRHRFDLIHAVVGTYRPEPFAALAAARVSPLVADYVDFREVMFDTDEALRLRFGAVDAAAERAQWRTLFTGADGILYMDSPEVVDLLAARHGARPPSLRFCTCCCEEFLSAQPDPERMSSAAPPRRLVFAGGLHASAACHGFEQHQTILDAARALTAGGLEFTIINATDGTGQGFEPFLELARTNPGFRYRLAVPNDRLGDALQDYDLGWNALDFRQGVESGYYFRTLFSSKLYGYLDAGLPVAVSRQTRFVADFVEEHGIGITLDWEELDDLPARIRGTDWREVRANVARLRLEHSMTRQFPAVLAFYNQIMGRQAFPADGGAPA